jgi:hypothetical protein
MTDQQQGTWFVTVLAQRNGGEVVRSLSLTPDQYVAFERMLHPFLNPIPAADVPPPPLPSNLEPTKVMKTVRGAGRRPGGPRRADA